MALPKWNEDRVAILLQMVEGESPVSQATVNEAAATLETSTRSISSKLRTLDVEVELASSNIEKKYSDEQEDALRNLVIDNSGDFTYAEIAAAFEGSKFSAKSVQGKILSMELTEHVKKTEKKEVVRKYTDEEEVIFIKMVENGDFAEDIAAALNKPVNSVRGKGLSLLKTKQIKAVPVQRETVKKVDALNALGDVSEKTVQEIADEIEKSVRGVKTMLTRRGIDCSDYKGKQRKEKAAS